MIVEAIMRLYPHVVVISGEAMHNVVAKGEDGNVVALDESLIQAEVTRLQTEYDNNLFQRQRADAYPSMQEQADMQYWDSVNGTTTWQDAIALVKSTYPKGGS